MNRAVDFILQNLEQSLKLEEVARAAGFSPFHFHRIFRSMVGESLNQFVKRLRLERSIALMSQKSWDTRRCHSLTDIAIACGFNSPSDFSRCFRQRYGMPPSEFDVDFFRMKRRKEWQTAVNARKNQNRHLADRLKSGTNPDGFKARLRTLGPRTVAYIRVLGCFREDAVPSAAERLLRWAEGRGLADGQWLGYMWDDPEIVPHHKCRCDIGVEIPFWESCREVGRIDFPAMLVAEVDVSGPIEVEMRALDWLFGTWLPSSGYAPTNQPGFEAFREWPFSRVREHFEFQIQVPVERC